METDIEIHEYEGQWLAVEPDSSTHTFPNEAEACAFQRGYRVALGLDPMTGEARTNTIPPLDLARDFHTLTSSEVSQVLAAADAAKYRKPKDANGSRARYYWAKLQRDARRPT